MMFLVLTWLTLLSYVSCGKRELARKGDKLKMQNEVGSPSLRPSTKPLPSTLSFVFTLPPLPSFFTVPPILNPSLTLPPALSPQLISSFSPAAPRIAAYFPTIRPVALTIPPVLAPILDAFSLPPDLSTYKSFPPGLSPQLITSFGPILAPSLNSFTPAIIPTIASFAPAVISSPQSLFESFGPAVIGIIETTVPSALPSKNPSRSPTWIPSVAPTRHPSAVPTRNPSVEATSAKPTSTFVQVAVTQEVNGISLVTYNTNTTFHKRILQDAILDSLDVDDKENVFFLQDYWSVTSAVAAATTASVTPAVAHTVSASVAATSTVANSESAASAVTKSASIIASTSTAASKPSLRRRASSRQLTSSSAIDLSYRLAVYASSTTSYSTLSTALANSISSGNFTATLHRLAAAHNMTSLANCSSSSVSVVDATTITTTSSSSSSSSTITTMIIIIVVVVVGVCLLALTAFAIISCRKSDANTEQKIYVAPSSATSPAAGGMQQGGERGVQIVQVTPKTETF